MKPVLLSLRHYFGKDLKFLLFIVCFWPALSLFLFLKAGIFRSLAEQTVHWPHIFSYTFTSGLLWIPFTLFAWWMVGKVDSRNLSLSKQVVFYILLSILASFLQRSLSMSLDYLIQTSVLEIAGFPSFGEYLNGHFMRRWVEGMLWFGMITVAVMGYLRIRTRQFADTPETKPGYLTIKKRGSQIRVATNDLLYVESKSNYCYLHTDREVYKMRITLKKLEEELEGSSLERVHHSFMVNAREISGFEHKQNGTYLFTLHGHPTKVSSSKTYRHNTQKIISLLNGQN